MAGFEGHVVKIRRGCGHADLFEGGQTARRYIGCILIEHNAVSSAFAAETLLQRIGAGGDHHRITRISSICRIVSLIHELCGGDIQGLGQAHLHGVGAKAGEIQIVRQRHLGAVVIVLVCLIVPEIELQLANILIGGIGVRGQGAVELDIAVHIVVGELLPLGGLGLGRLAPHGFGIRGLDVRLADFKGVVISTLDIDQLCPGS